MSEHLPSVMRAAERICTRLARARQDNAESVAEVIEQETSLPELLAAAEAISEQANDPLPAANYYSYPKGVANMAALRAAIALARKEKP